MDKQKLNGLPEWMIILKEAYEKEMKKKLMEENNETNN